MAGGCAVRGGCSSDYIAVAFAVLCFLLLLVRSILPLLVHKGIRINSRAVGIPVIQVIASFNLLLSLAMSSRILPFEKTYWWQSCYIWAVWVEGPLGFGLLLSCRIAQTYQLYYVFAKARLPPFRSYITLPVLLLPWIIVATCIHVRRPLNQQCHMGISWAVPYICLHAVYVVALVLFTNAVRHIEFRFNELRDLWNGILVSATSVGIWVSAYILNEVYDDISWLQTASRFVLLVMASILVVVFFSMSSSQPLLSVISFKQTDPSEFESIGRVLGIPDSGLLQKEPDLSFDPSEPLHKLLRHRRFRRSLLEFAESCYAGECVHFYEEVHERGKIPQHDPVRRIYMTRHIIEKYIITGAEMEVNISHRTRQGILNTSDLTHRDLFKNAVDEVIWLIKTNLMNDYWSSIFFIKFKEETGQGSNNGIELGQITTSRNLSPSLCSVHSSDDALCQEHLPKSPGSTNPG